MRKNLYIIMSLAVSITLVITFINYASASRNELLAELMDMYGDTSGIHNLTVNGLVADYNSRYAYSFLISPQISRTDVRVHKSYQDVNDDYVYRTSPSFYQNHQIDYIPVGPVREETVESENSYTVSSDGVKTPFMENRIYADVFEVVLKYEMRLKLDESKGKLYRAPGADGYIYATIYYEGYPDFYQAGFQNQRSARLPGELRIGDRILIVPVGMGLYGHTALYEIDAPRGVIPMVREYGYVSYNEQYVVAEELYPIELERDRDEILGILEYNGDVLLMIKRGEYFEIIRINPETGESKCLIVDGNPDFFEYFLTESSLVFTDYAWNNNGMEFWAFDLTGSDIRLAMHAKTKALWDEYNEGIYHGIEDINFKDGTLYMAEYVTKNANMHGAGANEVYISAIDANGGLVGRCQVMCGVEEDNLLFWMWDAGNVQSKQVRSLRSLTIW